MAVLGVAALITAATQPPHHAVNDRVEGPGLVVSADEPTASIPVTIVASARAVDRAEFYATSVTSEVIWAGTDDAMSLSTQVDLVPRAETGEWPRMLDYFECADTECRLDYDLVVRLVDTGPAPPPGVDRHLDDESGATEQPLTQPDTEPTRDSTAETTSRGAALTTASGQVEWSVFAELEFGSRPRDGDWLRIELGDAVGATLDAVTVANWRTADGEEPFVVQTVRVDVPAALPGDLQLVARFRGENTRALTDAPFAADEPTQLPPTSWSRQLEPPASCYEGPCTFTFETTSHLWDPGSRYLSVDWALMSSQPVSVGIEVERREAHGSRGRAQANRVLLEADEVARFDVVAEVPAAALPAHAWPAGHAQDELWGPLLLVTLTPHADREASTVHERTRMVVESVFVQEDGRRQGPGQTSFVNDPGRPGVRAPLPHLHHCRPDEPCAIRLRIDVTLEPDRRLGTSDDAIVFTPDFEVAMLLPQGAPGDAQIDVSVTRLTTNQR